LISTIQDLQTAMQATYGTDL